MFDAASGHVLAARAAAHADAASVGPLLDLLEGRGVGDARSGSPNLVAVVANHHATAAQQKGALSSARAARALRRAGGERAPRSRRARARSRPSGDLRAAAVRSSRSRRWRRRVGRVDRARRRAAVPTADGRLRLLGLERREGMPVPLARLVDALAGDARTTGASRSRACGSSPRPRAPLLAAGGAARRGAAARRRRRQRRRRSSSWLDSIWPREKREAARAAARAEARAAREGEADAELGDAADALQKALDARAERPRRWRCSRGLRLARASWAAAAASDGDAASAAAVASAMAPEARDRLATLLGQIADVAWWRGLARRRRAAPR